MTRPRRQAPDRRQFLDGLEDIVIDIECGAHNNTISHHASDVNSSSVLMIRRVVRSITATSSSSRVAQPGNAGGKDPYRSRRGSGGIGRGWIVWSDDPDRGDRLVISRQLRLEAPVLLEREPLPVGPVSSVATGLLRELGTVSAGIDGHRLSGGRASHDPRVDRHGDRHLMCRQRHRVVLHTTLVAKNHLPILRACSIPGP